jgi:hypothetical protein
VLLDEEVALSPPLLPPKLGMPGKLGIPGILRPLSLTDLIVSNE